jgi:DtxR family transcriptional regulator, Mn-dependent transcriptional regulator
MPELPHSRFRSESEGSNTEAVQDYAKAIFALERRLDGPVSNSSLAERLGVSPASVTAMLKRMDEAGLVAHEPYRGVCLTPAGERVALEVMRHHRLLEAYLADVLDMSWDRVHREAEVLEHYISEDLEERIATALGDPSHDPHGDPIPNRKLELAPEEGVRLADLEVGHRGVLIRVSDSNPEILRYLAERGIRLGARIHLAGREPFDGPLLVDVEGKTHPLSGQLTRVMRVRLDGTRSRRR